MIKLWYNQVVIVKFDPFLQTDTQLLSVTESTTSTIAPTLSCSFSGATWIVYTLESYNGANIPSFVQISALSGILSIAAPSVSNTADYSFYIDSAVSGVPSPVRKIVKLTVNKWTASNCQQCSPINSTVCVNCNSGYSLNSGSCILSESENSKILSIINQVVIGAILLLSLGFSLANLSSMEILWSVINQKQIFL